MDLVRFNRQGSATMLIGHGVDVVDLADFAEILQKFGDYLDQSFTEAEVMDAGSGGNRIARLAGRLAAKEAVLKALGHGIGDGIGLTDVEIRTHETGSLYVVLHGGAHRLASNRGVSAWLISTTHTDQLAFASAIALSS